MVSVVIPCFNAAKTVSATLRSALAEPEADEIIVVDDGSTDGSPELLRQLASSEPRLHVLAQANAGASQARNAGLSAVRGNFVAFLDSDDLWHRGHLATNLARLERQPDLGVSFSRARFIDADGRTTGVSRPRLEGLGPEDFLSGNPLHDLLDNRRQAAGAR